ncbi:family 10 glycosylhydrolase [Paucibacter sp. AS339]|uniref:glycoside hydrolase family 10 protein n=1 Tax=Paucibacter hankyongi TaxID=3133434 RepID=UPI0030B32A9B
MNAERRSFLIGATGCLGITACTSPTVPPAPLDVEPGTALRLKLAPELAALAPQAPREFRAAWVATVANIDWPSRKGLSSTEQQAEAIALLDQATALKLNAIVLQVRTSADALYASTLEPWSEYLSGIQGQAPEPFYDPLSFWVEQAHRRGLELHAWFNPFRARQSHAASSTDARHLSRSQPQWVKRCGDQLWIDPGEPAAAEHTLAVIQDVLQRYDIDAVHIDDYFYPYPVLDPVSKQELDFPDEPAWQRYLQTGGTLKRADWRRQNVDQLVQRLQQLIRSTKPGVRFGISPFGLGKPALRPAGIAGFSQYDKLYADVERWLSEGWLDYLAPQLYWPIAQKAQAFEVLRDYWQAQNPQQRHIWPGLFTSKITDKADSWPSDEIVNQIALSRDSGANKPSAGHLHFSMVALKQNRRGIKDALLAGPYASPALAPATPWLAEAVEPATAPQVRLSLAAQSDHVESYRLRLSGGIGGSLRGGGGPQRYAVWLRYAGSGWVFSSGSELLIAAPGLEVMVVSALDRIGREGPRVAYALN